MKRLALAVLVALVALVACDGAERREAQSVVSAVGRFRRAENPDKPAAADGLRALTCSAPDVCHARDACLASAEPTAKALRLKSEVEQGLAALEKGTLAKDSPEAQALPQKLDEAERLLREGRDKLGACDDEIMALKRKHGI